MYRAPLLLRAATRATVTHPAGARAAAMPPPFVARGSSSSAGEGSSSTTPTTGSRPRKPSPYRIPTLPTFHEQFTPLHAAGWRLRPLASGNGATSGTGNDLASPLDLQGHELVRAFAFPRDRTGWRSLRTFLSDVTEIVEAEDHHPVITAAPSSDLPADSAPLAQPDTYAVVLATHTHTPMPPLKVQFEGRPKPGVTGKDLRFAERVEEVYSQQTN